MLKHQIIGVIPLLPLLGFIILTQLKNYKQVGLVACFSILCSFLVTLYLFTNFLLDDEIISFTFYSWIAIEGLGINVGLLLDKLSFVMVLIITGIGFLIHLFSIGYMQDDSSSYRYFSYLNLFVFFMLLLVMADNLVLLFLGWEGVGLCSYLLIGYYFEKKSATKAAKKAFVVNRIGDFFMIIAMMLILSSFASFDFLTIKESLATGSYNSGTINWICLLLFLSATGKSAQLPLHIWLPDAMEGPTPVSALIHAATMVTAGVYLLARLNFLFILSPLVLAFILIIGSATTLLGALIATVQTDVKKILAYSTISQLGYMFMALGTAAFSSAIFHLTTHAFFKALLFLSAGALIYALHHEQDIRKMGGLKKKLPQVWFAFSVGAWCLAGLPLASGFFSKDEILWNVYQGSFYSIWFLAVGILVTLISAIYTYRMINLIFYATPTVSQLPKEIPVLMKSVLFILAIGSVLVGFLGLPHLLNFIGIHNLFSDFFSTFFVSTKTEIQTSTSDELLVIGISVLLSFIGMGWMNRKYYAKSYEQKNSNFLIIFLERKFYIEEFYKLVIVNPLKLISQHFFLNFFEGKIFRLYLLKKSFYLAGSLLSLWQNGQIARYGLTILAATVFLLYLIFFLI